MAERKREGEGEGEGEGERNLLRKIDDLTDSSSSSSCSCGNDSAQIRIE